MTVERFRAGKRLWNPEDEAWLRAHYPHEPTSVVAQRLRRTVAATYARADLLRLNKSAAYLASPLGCRLRRGDNVGVRTRFQKGAAPANKGLRRPGWSAGRMRETQFKHGERSGRAAHLWMPIDSTRLIDGYVYRKVADIPNVPYSVNWKPEHVLIWERTHGPKPPGHALVFRNGNRFDLRLDNLELITRRELMARNSVHNLPKPLASIIQLLGALHRQIRKRTDSHEKQDRRSA